MAQKNNDIIFVFEVCVGCSQHRWNTRHDEQKYLGYFERVSELIKTAIPNAVCVMNKVPKLWYDKPIYCQMVPNDDEREMFYQMVPRVGAFEVSTVINGTDILLYSKMMSSMWPHARALTVRCKELIDNKDATATATLKDKFQTKGQQNRQRRETRDMVSSNSMAASSTSNLYSQMALSQASFQSDSPKKKGKVNKSALVEEIKVVEEKDQSPAIVISEAITAKIDALALYSFSYYYANAAQSHKDYGAAELQRFTTDEAYGEAEMVKCQAAFTKADVDGDKLLNVAEYTTFHNILIADNVAKGGFNDTRPEALVEEFEAFNYVNEAEAGISYDAYCMGMEIMVTKFCELQAAAEAQQASSPEVAQADVPEAVQSTSSVDQSAQEPQKLIFGYWNMRGGARGNPSRYMLNYAGVPYEEKTYITQSGDWNLAKEGLMPFVNLPYIVDGDVKISETMAVQTYIADKFKPELLGSTPQERAKVYQLLSISNESFMNAFKAILKSENKEEMANIFHEKMDPLVAQLAGKEFLNGENICVADFVFFENIDYLQQINGGKTWSKYPSLEAYHGRVKNLPGMKQFYESSDKMRNLTFLPHFAKIQL